MQELIKDIPISELKNYLISAKNCRVTAGGYELISRHSSLSFKFTDGSKCVVIASRKSGNGANLISSGQNTNTDPVISTRHHEAFVSIDSSGMVVIKRPYNAVGSIEVSGIRLYREVADPPNWNEVLGKCSANTCMKLVDGKLLASSGGYVEAEVIRGVETSPANLYKTEGGRVTFLGECEVVRLEVEGSGERVFEAPVQMEAPAKVEVVERVLSDKTVILDTAVIGFNAAFIASDAQLSGIHLGMGHRGEYIIRGLEGGYTYTVSVEADVLNGNGRLAIGLENSKQDRMLGILNPRIGRLVATLEMQVGEGICIFRPGATGQIVIKRILISGVKIKKEETDETYTPIVYEIPKINIDNSGGWNLRVPKIVHFYWGGNTLPFLRYVSMYSFIKHNPDWKVKFHVPEILGNTKPTWRTAEQQNTQNAHKQSKNYTQEFQNLNVEIIKHDFNKYGFRNDVHEVHKSDLLRWLLLANEGGLWSDNDIIYTKPMVFLKENSEPEASSCDTFLCKYESDMHAIGFMASGGNNDLFNIIAQIALKSFSPKAYQSIGACLLNTKFNTIQKSAPNNKVCYLSPDSVYCINDASIPSFNSIGLNPESFSKNSIGFHWYGGHSSMSTLEAAINNENYNGYNNFIGKLVQMVLNDNSVSINNNI